MNYAQDIIISLNSRLTDESVESDALQDAVNAIRFGSSDASDDYITYRIITSQHEQTFTSFVENTLVQFDIYSKLDTTCLKLMNLLEEVLDDTTLPLDEYSQIEVTRNNANFVGHESDTGLNHYYIEYDINLEKNKE